MIRLIALIINTCKRYGNRKHTQSTLNFKPLLYLLTLLYIHSISGQTLLNIKTEKEIYSIIEQYSRAREQMDTILLKSILTDDIDQLVSSGEWRIGIDTAIKGMMKSSASNTGSRKIVMDRYRLLTASSAIADARYEIANPDGSARKMWSTFILVKAKNNWKISAIRNMLPVIQ